MSDESQQAPLGIYVLPSEPNVPPTAVIAEVIIPAADGVMAINGATAIWNADMGAWCIEGNPVPQEVGDAITAHAKALGVEW
jgi:hypothetical protein